MLDTLANASTHDLLWVAGPILLILSGVVSFEIAAALTISTLPRSRAQQRWTPHESRRVARLFCSIFIIWPASAGAVLAYIFLPTPWAIASWALAFALLSWVAYTLFRANRNRRRVLEGHCVGCLYDLRGSLDRDHCPECGTDLTHHPAIRRLRRATRPSPRL
ncbi:MAG: hypothetical protein AAGA29_08570 [Planctomycetota bacterium]